jgi:hypothetical protein
MASKLPINIKQCNFKYKFNIKLFQIKEIQKINARKNNSTKIGTKLILLISNSILKLLI